MSENNKRTKTNRVLEIRGQQNNLLDDKTLETLLINFKEILADYINIEHGRQLNPIDAFFTLRLFLGRNPSLKSELPEILNTPITYREFFDNLSKSEEFRNNVAFLPPEQIWMTKNESFRFWFNTSDKEMGVQMALGRYEPHSVQLIRSILKPGMRCLDAGANTGYYSCLFASIVGNRGKIYAFEPMPNNYNLLVKNINENKFENIVQHFQLACSNSNETISGAMVSNMYIAGEIGAGEKISMEAVRVDDVVKDSIDFIKIDIEGHEPAGILGMKSIISKCKPIIFSEINEYWLRTCSNSSANEYVKLLYSLGYDVYDIRNNNRSVQSNLTLDILGTMDIIAIPKGTRLQELLGT